MNSRAPAPGHGNKVAIDPFRSRSTFHINALHAACAMRPRDHALDHPRPNVFGGLLHIRWRIHPRIDHRLDDGTRLSDIANAARRVVLMATGSEVELAITVADRLETQGIGADVVSMPCWERFEAQDAAYRADVVPEGPLLVSIEAGVTLGWERYTAGGIRIGIDSFGASAPADQLYDYFGFSVEAILNKIQTKLDN